MVAYAAPTYEPIHKVSSQMNGGVNYQAPASKIGDNQFSDLLNLQYYLSIIRKDTGYAAFNQQVRGTPQKVYQFQHTTGIIELLLITQATVYRNNQSQWQEVSDGTNAATTTTSQVNAGNNVFPLTANHFNVNDFVGIVLSDGTQLQTQVTVSAGLNITTSASVPVGKNAPSGTAVIRPPVLAGSDDFPITDSMILTWAPQNWVIFTNGVDHVKYYDGTNVLDLVGWAATVTSCRGLVAFNGFILAFDTTEGGSRLPYRVRNTDQGNPNALIGGTLSGFVDLLDTEDFILAAYILGPWVIIYRQNSVMKRAYIGDPLELFFDEYMLRSTEVSTTGVFAAGAVCSVGASHIFANNNGVFRYTGGYDVESIGDNIFDRFLGPTGTLNTSKQQRSFMMFIPTLDEVWLFIPTGSNSYPDTLLRYDQGDDSWWPRKFADPIVMADQVTAAASSSITTWNQLTGKWSAAQTPWISRAGTALAPQIALCDQVAAQVWLYDFVSTTDGGTNENFFLTTKDFEVITKKVRFDGLYAKGMGNNILVQISYDRGQTWQPVGTLNFGSTFTQQNVCRQLSVDVFRLMLSGNDPAFALDWARVDYFEETPW